MMVEFPYLSLFLPNVSILHNHFTFVETNTLTLAHYYQLDFTSFPANVLLLFQDPFGCRISSNLC